MWKLEPSCIAGGNAKWCRCCGKQSGGSSENWTWTYHMTPPPAPRYIPKRIKNVFTNVPISITHDGHKVETTQIAN